MLHPGRKVLSWLLAATAVATLVALVDLGAVTEGSALYPIATREGPYWLPGHVPLLYLRVPLVSISILFLVSCPGLCLALLGRQPLDLHRWVLHGFALTLPIVGVGTYVAEAAAGGVLTGRSYVVTLAVLSLLSWIIAWTGLRGRRSDPTVRGVAVDVLLLVVPPLLLLTGLLPKFLWENLNGDGAEALEAARLLLQQPVPYWGESFGVPVSWPGIVGSLFLYPASWLVRAFGALEASVRLPFLLYLGLLYCGLVAAVRARATPDGLKRIERCLLWAGLGVFAIVMAYSSSYGPYHADLASPASQNTLEVALFLGLVVAFLHRGRPWVLAFATLTYLGAPNGVLLLLLWLGAVTLIWKVVPWRRVGWTALAIGGLLLVSAAGPHVIPRLGLPEPGGLHGLVSSVERFRYLQYADFGRIVYVLLPAGIVAALWLPFWQRQDEVARSLSAVALAYAAAFYFKASVALHFFVPAMVLPLAVFWRSDRSWMRPRLQRALVAAGIVAAGVLSWPQDHAVHTQTRTVGESIRVRTAGYSPLVPATYRRHNIFMELVPLPSDQGVPRDSFGVSPLALNYYAHRFTADSTRVNYLVQPPEDPAPASMRRIAETNGAALFVRSDSVWRRHRRLRAPAPTAARPYAMATRRKLPVEARVDGSRVIDLCAVLQEGLGLRICG